jgi:hypothetical protein
MKEEEGGGRALAIDSELFARAVVELMPDQRLS